MAIVVNNHAEMFDESGSGAIATHIWECWQAATPKMRPTVYTRLGAATRYPVEPLCVVPLHESGVRIMRRLAGRLARARGWSTWTQKQYALAVRRRLDTVLAKGPAKIVLHNDPEIAVRLARLYPTADVRHLFHNLLEMSSVTHRALSHPGVSLYAVSDYVARWVERTAELPDGSVATVHNGVNSGVFAPPTTTTTRERFNIGFLGRPSIEKAPDVLLNAVSRMHDLRKVRVLLAGANHVTHHVQDDYQQELDLLGDRIIAHGGQFERLGQLSRSRVADFLRKLDVLVVPSRWEEPFALVVLEGMATGLPVVASRTGGVPEVIGDAGILFEPDDVDALREILDELLREPEKRRRLSVVARARALQFTWHATWDALVSVETL